MSRVGVGRLGVCLLLLAACGCGDDPLAPDQQALADARARWEAAGPSAYTYHYRRSCFCPPQLLETARVSVSDGQVTAVHLLDSDAPAPPDTYDLYETVEGLFERLAVAPIRVPLASLRSVDSIAYLDPDGASQTLDPSAYQVSTGAGGLIVPAYGRSWPTHRRYLESVSVRLVVGYGADADAVPEHVMQAIKLLVGHWFANREEVVVGTVTKRIEMAASALLDPEDWGAYPT